MTITLDFMNTLAQTMETSQNITYNSFTIELDDSYQQYGDLITYSVTQASDPAESASIQVSLDA